MAFGVVGSGVPTLGAPSANLGLERAARDLLLVEVAGWEGGRRRKGGRRGLERKEGGREGEERRGEEGRLGGRGGKRGGWLKTHGSASTSRVSSLVVQENNMLETASCDVGVPCIVLTSLNNDLLNDGVIIIQKMQQSDQCGHQSILHLSFLEKAYVQVVLSGSTEADDGELYAGMGVET